MRSFSSRIAPLTVGVLLGLVGACTGSSPVSSDSANPPAAPPVVGVSSTALVLGGGTEIAVALVNQGTEPVSWRGESNAIWVRVSPTQGLVPPGELEVSVTVDRTDLEPGTHRASIRFWIDDQPFDVEVVVEVSAEPPPAVPRAVISPASLTLEQDDDTGVVTVSNPGTGPLSWSWSGPAWIQLTPSSGTTPAGGTTAVTVAPDRTALADGVHDAVLTFASDGGSSTVAVTVTVASPAELSLVPSRVDAGENGVAASLTIVNDGGRPLSWTATSLATWLRTSPTGGAVPPHSTAPLALAIDRGTLAAGTYSTTLSIASNGGAAGVPVTMRVPAPPPPDPAPPPPDPTPPPPDPTPPPPDPTPPPSSTALAGRVTSEFSGASLAGLSVSFAGGTAVTDASGNFAIAGSASSSLRDLSIAGAGVYSRSTFARTGDSEWRVVPSSFDMNAFDDIAREYEPRTIRWTSRPSVYVDVRPDGFAGGADLDAWVQEVRSQAPGFVSDWTAGTVTVSSVSVGSSPPADGTPGTIVIHFSEDATRYPGPNTVGLARTFWSGDRSISSATVWLRFARYAGPGNATIRTAVLGHELGHALGLGHMDGSTPSIMTANVSSSSLTSFDGAAGWLLYDRSPGNTSPDVDSAATYRGMLSPARQAAGSFSWVCGEPRIRR